MKVFEGFDQFPTCNNAIVTDGTFDGIHLGHQTIISRVIQLAKENKGESVMLTFWPHPRHVLEPSSEEPKLLTSFNEKAQALADIGLDYLIKIPFTKAFSNTSSDEFIQKILIEKVGTKRLVIGYDHHFGKDRRGSFQYLMNNRHRFGIALEEIPKQKLEDVAISSSAIREAISIGDVLTANKHLGRCYTISGTVKKGDQIGRTIGYPTANISIDTPYKLIPADGVYAVKVKLEDQLYDGMFYIGNRPSIVGTNGKSLEVNIFNFELDIYDKNIQVKLIERIRGDQYFDNLEDLKSQLFLDKINTLKVLNS